MLNWFLHRRIAAFEAVYGYDMSYGHAVLRADRGAFLALARVMRFSAWRKDVPQAAYFAAKIAAAQAEDCGPCMQLAVTMAERAGCAPGVLRAVLAGEITAMGEDAGLAWRFATAVLAHDTRADALRDAVAAKWGQRAVISLAYAITTGRLFPTLKYALGHGEICSRVAVDGKPVAMARAA